MNSSSAECAFEALRRGCAVPILSLLSSRFALCCNCCTADKAASNGRFLKARAVLDAFAFHIGTFCRIHCLCTATSRCMKLDTVEDDVSGVVRFGLALRPTGTTKCVRDCLADVLMWRHEIKPHEAPMKPDDARTLFRRRLLQVLLPGPLLSDVRRRHVLDLHVSTITPTGSAYHGHVADKRAVVEEMARAILPAAIAVLQRGRWMRNVTPWRDVALFFWFGGGEALLKWLPAPKASEAVRGQWDLAENAEQMIVPYCELGEDEALADPNSTWAEKNRQNKRCLRAFALTRPAERLLMHVIALALATRLNDRYLTAGRSS